MRQEVGSIASKRVGLRPLAAPDCFEFDLAAQHICLISDNESSITPGLAEAFRMKGWPVVIIRYYQKDKVNAKTETSISAGNEQVPVITFTSDEEVQVKRQIEDIVKRFGPIGGFIHLHPDSSKLPDTSVHFDVISESILRQLFFTAKFIQPYLKTASQWVDSATRAFFMTVTQLDGGFGMLGVRDIDVVAGGCAGLTKTLALEWLDVFCRNIDLSPAINSEATRRIIDELHDPDQRLREVAWSHEGRVTVEAK